MLDETVTTADLLDAWREAVRAAELAERLARLASETVSQADVNAATAQEVAGMAEQVAKSAVAAAERAQSAADETLRIAQRDRETLTDAYATEATSRAAEAVAHEAYRSSSDEASARHQPRTPSQG